MPKPNSPYEFDTHDVASAIARDVYVDTGPTVEELTALIERKLDEFVRKGNIRVYPKRHYVTE